MSLKIKIFTPLLIFAVAIVFSGCGKKSPEPMPIPNIQEASDDSSETLPKPTGKVDDAVDAVIEEMETEEAEIEKEESEAEFLMDDSEETDDFGESYDENEF